MLWYQAEFLLQRACIMEVWDAKGQVQKIKVRLARQMLYHWADDIILSQAYVAPCKEGRTASLCCCKSVVQRNPAVTKKWVGRGRTANVSAHRIAVGSRCPARALPVTFLWSAWRRLVLISEIFVQTHCRKQRQTYLWKYSNRSEGVPAGWGTFGLSEIKNEAE